MSAARGSQSALRHLLGLCADLRHRNDLPEGAARHRTYREQIVRRLAEDSEPRPCGTLELGLSKSTMTHHFRILREAGVVEQRREGTARLTSLRRDDLDARVPGLLDAVLASQPAPA